jgi:hypothetical protein
MDPLGLAFEHFDALGSYRETDRGLAIDTSGDLDGTPFQGPRDLAALIQQSPAAAACMVKQVYRYATGHMETDGESSILDGIGTRFVANGMQYLELVSDVVSSDGFRFATTPP